jgi:hypothetical protein
MDLHNPYEAEFLRKDQAKRIAHQAKQYQGTKNDQSLALGRILSAVVILGTCLSFILGR